MEDQQADVQKNQPEGCDFKENEDPFATEEIELEEVTIDGICGVY